MLFFVYLRFLEVELEVESLKENVVNFGGKNLYY